MMCKEFGADLVYTEFVSSDALIRQVNKSMQKLAISDEERPVAIQIYGRDVDSMTEAARIVDKSLYSCHGRRKFYQGRCKVMH